MYLRDDCARATVFFGFDWFFRLAEEGGDNPGEGLEGYRPIQLPHDWSLEYPFDENSPTFGSGGYVKAGVGWYKKRFRVSGPRKKVSVLFDGAYMCAKVWLNGKILGEHVYGYTPFEFDITDILDYETENEFTVRIDNSIQPNSRWYTGSGITRDVWLISVNKEHIPKYGTYITAEIFPKNEARVHVAAKMELQESVTLETSIYDREGGLRARSEISVTESGEVIQEIPLSNPRLWSADTPYLYKAVSRLIRGGTTLDEYKTVFGIRSVEFDADRGCIINGSPVKLNGVCVHHDGGSVGAAVPKKVWQRRLERLKEMGCNAIRCAHNPPDPGLLDLCDEMGFYVMDEAFDEWAQLKWKIFGSNTHESRGYSEWFNEHHVSDMEAMLYRDRNHPSVIMWSIGNEVPEQTMETGHLLAKKLQDICHRIDPSRLCTQANDQICAEPRRATDEFLNTLDIVGYNYTGRWRTRAETLYESDKRKNPHWRILGAENISAAGRRGDYRMAMPENYWRRAYYSAPVNAQRLLRFTMSHDYVMGDFMWTGIDYLGEAHWPDRSASSGVLDTCGFPKDHFYFYKSIWNRKEPFTYIFPHRNLDFPEGLIIPVLCYTNCEAAELFVNGKSYGKKSYSYPLYGMTETYGHWDSPPVAAHTDDMFLSWDVPVTPETIEVAGYKGGKEVCRHKVETAGEAAIIKAVIDTDTLQSDGRDIVHIEISLTDVKGVFNPIASNKVYIKVEGPAELIGLDNGKPDCHESFKGDAMSANGGLLLAIVRAKRESGEVSIRVESEGLAPAVVKLKTVSVDDVYA
jgi:beta-galactosidase